MELSAAATASGTNTLTFTATNVSVPKLADVTRFTDEEDMKRLGSYWTIGEEGRIFLEGLSISHKQFSFSYLHSGR